MGDCFVAGTMIAIPTGELMKKMRRMSWRRRQLDGDQQLVRRKDCFIDPGEECVRGNPPLTVRTASNDGRAKRDHASRQFGRWIGVSRATPDCATVADRGMRDMGGRLHQQWGT